MRCYIRLMLALLIGTVILNGGIAEAKKRKPKKLVHRGVIETLSESNVSLAVGSFTLNSRTKYEDFDGSIISLSAFTVGDCVKIKLTKAPNSKIVKEMELEDSCSSEVSPTPTVGSDDITTPTPAPTETPEGCDDSNGRSDDDHRGRGRGRGSDD